ncbi:MAG: BolA family transcriptional regulator [Gammaproteobacteria bacterium]|nr:BolA family transcriptional regulator [Gammaproteobacteria bacterium]
MTIARTVSIEAALIAAFSPDHLLVKDQSHLHAGHAGAREGLGHFEVIIVADAFQGLSRIECHRRIYDALSQLMTTDIHALTIRASVRKIEPS